MLQAKRLNSFNFFRVFGAIVIFLCHLKLKNGIGGSLGLDIFFVLSGFCIYWGYADKIGEGKTISLTVFMKKRVLKIYPVYFIMIAVGFIYMVAICGFSLISTTIKLPGHLLFLQPFVKQYSTAFNGAGWYVATLMWMYLFFYMIKSGKTSYVVISIWTVVLILVYYLFNGFIQGCSYDFSHSPLTTIVYFYIGVFGAKFFKTYQLSLSRLSFSLLEFVLLALLVYCIFIPDPSFVCNIFVCVFIAILYYVYAHEKGILSQFFGNKFFSVCASYSFYFYMTHYMIIQYAVHLFNLEYTSFVVSFALFIATIICSVGLKKLDEYVQFKYRQKNEIR